MYLIYQYYNENDKIKTTSCEIFPKLKINSLKNVILKEIHDQNLNDCVLTFTGDEI